MDISTNVRSHAHLIAAADFFTTEVWNARGLVTYFTLFVIDVATRRVYVAGTTTNPTSSWMEQIARNLTDVEDGFLNGKRFLAPNMNAHAERFVKSIKSECFDKMIFLGRESLVRAISEYTDHYHGERSHQGIGNELISAAESQSEGSIHVRGRPGGLLKYYHRRAA